MDPERSWRVATRRCFACEARSQRAESMRETGGSLDGVYFSVIEDRGLDGDEEVTFDD